jgi:hypothetical protein
MNDRTDEGGQSGAVADDPIVAEVRAVRDAIFAEAGYDIAELCRQLRARQLAAGRTAVTLPPTAGRNDSHAA